jgi:hypothetical protein
MGIFDRLGSIAQSDAGKAFDTAHEHFQHRLNVHGHFGRALVESIAETCRNHPSIVGIAVGVMVEQLLVHEKHHHEHVLEAEAEAEHNGHAPPPARTAPPHAPHHELKLWRVRPWRIAFEVFGALVLLKFGVGVAKIFSRKRPALAPAARIRLFSATFAAYFAAKTVKSHEVSAWRNAAALLFATDALKPLLRPDFSRPPPSPHRPPPARANGDAHPPAPAPPDDGHELTVH